MYKAAQRMIPLTDYGWRIVFVLALVIGVVIGYMVGVL